MNRTTIAVSFLLAIAGTAGAQVSPTPPAKPARPAPAAAPVAPAVPLDPDLVAPVVRVEPFIWNGVDVIDLDRVRQMAEEARAQARIEVNLNTDAIVEAQRAVRDAQRELNLEQLAEMREAAVEAGRAVRAFGFDQLSVPRPFFQGEPEDSLYRLAHDLLNRGDYGRAAQMFRDIAQKYPKSVYIDDLPYYEALARYRIGTTEELQRAVRLLEPRASKLSPAVSQAGDRVIVGNINFNSQRLYSSSRRGASDGDIVGLYTRINSTLASRGDRAAADRVAKLAQAGANTCNPEDMQVRVEALSGLASMDPAAATSKIRQVLDNKDNCSERLRSRAVFILGSKRGDAEAASLIATVAKSDPSRSVRMDAINWLPKLQGDAGVAALEDLLRTETDESIQRQIVRTLVSSDNPKARSSMRTLIDRKDASMNLRIEAINSYGNDRATTDDAAYLRNFYSKAENDRMRDAVISAVARMGGQENEQWILNIAKNPNEPSQARGTAISRLIRSNMAISDVVRLYDVSDNYNVRAQIINVLGSRKEPEATDKLFEIAKTSTVTDIRLRAIRSLTNRKNDPRAAELLLEILDGKSKTP